MRKWGVQEGVLREQPGDEKKGVQEGGLRNVTLLKDGAWRKGLLGWRQNSTPAWKEFTSSPETYRTIGPRDWGGEGLVP